MRTIWPAVETFRLENWDTGPLLAPFELNELDLEDHDRRVPQDVVTDLWDRAASLSQDPSFGLRALRSLSKTRRSLGEYLLLNSPSLGAMIERGIRFERLWQEGREASLRVNGELAVLEWTARPGLRFSRALSEFAVAMVVLLARAATGRQLAGEVRFLHPAPPDLRPYADLFSGKVAFAANAQALLFPAELLLTPLRKADPALLSVLEDHARELLERLPTARSFAQTVRQAVATSLVNGAPLDKISDTLGVSSRTLRRRLADEGLGYQELVDELRSELALRYLADPAISITEVAFLLGFSDGPAFTKAFRRWTGQSPSTARKRATQQ